MPPRILTKDPYPFMILAFGMAAGVVLIFTVLAATSAFGTFRALGRGAPDTAIRCDYAVTPPNCVTYDVRANAVSRLLWCIPALAVVVLLWSIGQRKRFVTLRNDTIRITWGRLLPVTVRTVPAAALNAHTITKEARFTVMPIAGTSVQRVNRVADRWRHTATAGKTTINLGSYATEHEAHRVATMLARLHTGETDEERDTWHYGRIA